MSLSERDRAGSDRLPSPIPGGQRLSSPPGDIGRCFPAGVRDLNTGHGTMLPDEFGDFPECRSLFPGPDSRIMGCDPSFGGNRGGFRHHQCGASDRPTPQVHKMPIRRHSIDGGILAHRGDEDPVPEYPFPQAKGGKQVRSVHGGSSSCRPFSFHFLHDNGDGSIRLGRFEAKAPVDLRVEIHWARSNVSSGPKLCPPRGLRTGRRTRSWTRRSADHVRGKKACAAGDGVHRLHLTVLLRGREASRPSERGIRRAR